MIHLAVSNFKKNIPKSSMQRKSSPFNFNIIQRATKSNSLPKVLCINSAMSLHSKEEGD